MACLMCQQSVNVFPKSKEMQLRLIGNSKLAVGMNTDGCLKTADLPRVHLDWDLGWEAMLAGLAVAGNIGVARYDQWGNSHNLTEFRKKWKVSLS